MGMGKFTVYSTSEYDEWFNRETPKSKFQIQDRLLRIMVDGHFGHMKDLDDDLWEIKFNDGRRIYYTIIPESNLLLLLGGNKNGQDKDIRQARKILSKARTGKTKRL